MSTKSSEGHELSTGTVWSVVATSIAPALASRVGSRMPESVAWLVNAAKNDERILMTAFLNALADARIAAEDDALGFRLGLGLPVGAFEVIEFVARSAPTGLAALRTLTDYYRIVSDQTVLELRETKHSTQLVVVSPLAPESIRDATELLFGILYRRIEGLAGADAVLEVRFAHAAPRDPFTHCSLVRGGDVRFGAPESALRLSTEALSRPLKSHDPELHEFLRTTAEKILLASPRRASLEERLRILLRRNEEIPSVDEAARRLGASTRTLQRRLHEVGSSYAEETDRVRRQRAITMLEEAGSTCDEVARRVGFLSAGSLTRAFRRWYGTTPSAYVEQKSTPPPPPPPSSSPSPRASRSVSD